MNLGPCFHQAALPLGKLAADELDCIDSEDTDVILIVRMEVRSVVGAVGSANMRMMIPKNRAISGMAARAHRRRRRWASR